MRLPSTNRRLAAVLGAALLTTSCATPAPPLPAERSAARPLESFSEEDAARTCEDIRRNWQETTQAREAASRSIAANRQQNQAAGYISAVFFLPAAIATEGNYSDKEALIAIQGRRDTLIELARTKGCPAPG